MSTAKSQKVPIQQKRNIGKRVKCGCTEYCTKEVDLSTRRRHRKRLLKLQEDSEPEAGTSEIHEDYYVFNNDTTSTLLEPQDMPMENGNGGFIGSINEIDGENDVEMEGIDPLDNGNTNTNSSESDGDTRALYMDQEEDQSNSSSTTNSDGYSNGSIRSRPSSDDESDNDTPAHELAASGSTLVEPALNTSTTFFNNLDPTSIAEMEKRKEFADDFKDNLNSSQINDLIGFTLRGRHGINSRQFKFLRGGFSDQLGLSSEYVGNKIAESLSEVNHLEISMCVKSCIAYDGEYKDLQSCPLCSEPRNDAYGRPRNVFKPIPISERLQGEYLDAKRSEHLQRPKTSDPAELSDKFDGNHIRNLKQQTVIVNGHDTGYQYFSDERDLSLTLGLDGFSFYPSVGRKISQTQYNAWVLILIIDNLSSEIRTRRDNIMVLGIIPGPGNPKDLNSFLVWFRDELHCLSLGILSWDAYRDEWFLLRAYLLFVIGDMPAIAHMMMMKGHNGILGCRSCYIRGIRDTSNTHYPALQHPNGQGYLIEGLIREKRTHQTFLEDIAQIERVKASGNRQAYEQLKKDTGINGRSILFDLPSVDFGRSFGHDIMHLFAANNIKNLVMLWSGSFKGLDQGTGNYHISEEKWKEVGLITERSFDFIPQAFSRRLPDIVNKSSDLTCEGWMFWFTRVAPHVLKGRLVEPYYSHAIDLIAIIKTCMSYTVTRAEIEGPFMEACFKWVRDYERLYYQYAKNRLPICVSTIHAIIHLPQDILNAGPLWMSWAFPIEREVQWNKTLTQLARHRPYAFLAKKCLRREQVKQLGYRLGIAEQLDIPARIQSQTHDGFGPSREELKGQYGDFTLMGPVKYRHKVDESIHAMIKDHIAEFYDVNVEEIDPVIPQRMEQWTKTKIRNRGDTIRGSKRRYNKTDRDTSFIRYHMVIRNTLEILYGQMHYILRFKQKEFSTHSSREWVFAVICPCITNGIDAALDTVSYTSMQPLGIADLTCIVSLIGRVFLSGREFGIIDRSMTEIWPSLADEETEALQENIVQEFVLQE